MHTFEGSLLDYLRLPNPTVNGERCFGKTNTSGKGYMEPGGLYVWEDFEYDTLFKMYNGELSRCLERADAFKDFSEISDFPFCEYSDENSLETLLSIWNQQVINEALKKSKAHLDETHERLYMAKGGQAERPWRNYKPDWACIKRSPNAPKEKYKNLLPGDTKPGRKWSSSVINRADGHVDRMPINDKRPLLQIYSYLIKNETRYGYIITEAELFVVRARLQPGESGSQQQQSISNSFNDPTHSENSQGLNNRVREVGVLDYKIIPWTATATVTTDPSSQPPPNNNNNNNTTMTVNLALWWLHMLAAGHTHIGDAQTYGALQNEVRSSPPTETMDVDTPTPTSRGFLAIRPVSPSTLPPQALVPFISFPFPSFPFLSLPSLIIFAPPPIYHWEAQF